jgi:CDGSH-type Zn-finger protein
MHAGECVRGLPSVFDASRTPWVTPDAASVDEVRAAVLRCPSGALHLTRRDGSDLEGPMPDNVVRVTANGPIHARGRLVVVDPAGQVLVEETRLALCRCGASNAKPFCDAQHRDSGFADAGELGTSASTADEAAGDGLEIRLRANGPLVLSGRFRLVSDDGSVSREMTKVALCRCGRSGNKPFCDGTHREGFVAE